MPLKNLVVVLLCVSLVDFARADSLHPPRCQWITTSVCNGLDYSQTFFPNLLNHATHTDAELTLNTWSPLLQSQCSPHLKRFLCYVHFPPCPENKLPCRSFCQQARRDCEPELVEFSYSWPQSLECDKFPDSHCMTEYGFTALKTYQDECQPIKITMCKGLHYDRTRLPTRGYTQNSIERELETYEDLLELCNPVLRVVICSVYVPPCGGQALPCRSVCLSAQNSCPRGFVFPTEMNCMRFPTHGCLDENGRIVHAETSTTTTPQPDNTNVTNNITERSDVQCGSDFITAEIPLELLPDVNMTSPILVDVPFTLQDPTCMIMPSYQVGKLKVQFGLNECGTVARFTNDAIVYKNFLNIHKTNQSIPIVCEYPRRKVLSMSYKPVQRNVRFFEKSFGTLNITMRQYTSDSFSTEIPHTSYPVSVKADEPVYIEVEASRLAGNSLTVFPGMCLATTSQTPHDSAVSHELIKNGCKSDPNVVIYKPLGGNLRFSFNAFSLASQTPVVYVHCDVLLCESSDLASECHQDCTGTASRTKRSVVTAAREGHYMYVSGGPLVLEDKRSITDSGLDAILVAVATVSMVVAVVSVMVAVITLRMKQTNTPNSTE